MSMYLAIRTIHIACALLSLSGFALRGYWMLRASPLLQHKLTRVLPHIIDSALLLSAIVLVLMSGFYPLATSWINIKLVLLVVYILLGTIALKRGKSPRVRAVAFVLSLITLAAIFATAIVKP